MKKLLFSNAEAIIYKFCEKWQNRVLDLYKDRIPQTAISNFKYRVRSKTNWSLQIICEWIKNDFAISNAEVSDLLSKFAVPGIKENLPTIILRV
jgi:hypothetical protein